MKGDLLYRPPRGNGEWIIKSVEIVDNSIYIKNINDENPETIENLEIIELDTTCGVFETNLGPNAFEIVTPRKILHFISESKEISSVWISALKEKIDSCILNLDDPFIKIISERIELDDHYEVEFRENKPLGVVLERSNESAIVKMSNFKESGIEAGSVLTSINDKPLENVSYHQAISYLKQWKPPLKLGFRKAPSKHGFLKKYTKDKSGQNLRTWKNRYFSLAAGHLQYREAESSSTKGDIPLMGSSISILTGPDVGDSNCFRILSGVTGIILQADNPDVMMDWVTNIYHAISLANGGKYLKLIQSAKAELLHKVYLDDQERQSRLRTIASIDATKSSNLDLKFTTDWDYEAPEIYLNDIDRNKLDTYLSSHSNDQNNTSTNLSNNDHGSSLNAIENLQSPEYKLYEFDNDNDKYNEKNRLDSSLPSHSNDKNKISTNDESALNSIEDFQSPEYNLHEFDKDNDRNKLDTYLSSHSNDKNKISTNDESSLNSIEDFQSPEYNLYEFDNDNDRNKLDTYLSSHSNDQNNSSTNLSNNDHESSLNAIENLQSPEYKLYEFDNDNDNEKNKLDTYLSSHSKDQNNTSTNLSNNEHESSLNECIKITPINNLSLVRDREILDLLENAIRLKFKAELKFAIHVAESAEFKNADHPFYEYYVTAKEFYKELENSEEEDNLDSSKFDINANTDMDQSKPKSSNDEDPQTKIVDDIYENENENENENDDVLLGDGDSIIQYGENENRRLARRKSKAYRFDSVVPATELELRQLFRSFTNNMGNSGSLNAIQLSNIWRLVTGEKGNLYKEMKLFQKFDSRSNGYLDEEDFVRGWFLIAKETGREDLLLKLRSIAEESIEINYVDTGRENVINYNY